MPDTWTQTIHPDTALRIIAIALSKGKNAGGKVPGTVVDLTMGLIASGLRAGSAP